MNVTADQLALATGARIDRAQAKLAAYNQALDLYGITSRLRMACLFANIGVESGGFRYTQEIWGPTPAQEGYEGRADLGNTQPGDGERFKGHGDLQITGRANHAAARDRLSARFPQLQVPDFEADPDALSLPLWAALAACDYVDRNSLNQYADVADFEAYCDLVNRGRVTAALGDSNGFPARLQLFVSGMRFLP